MDKMFLIYEMFPEGDGQAGGKRNYKNVFGAGYFRIIDLYRDAETALYIGDLIKFSELLKEIAEIESATNHTPIFKLLSRMCDPETLGNGYNLTVKTHPDAKHHTKTFGFAYSKQKKSIERGRLLEKAGMDNDGECLAAIKSVVKQLNKSGESRQERTLWDDWKVFRAYRSIAESEWKRATQEAFRERADILLENAKEIYSVNPISKDGVERLEALFDEIKDLHRLSKATEFSEIYDGKMRYFHSVKD